MAAKEWTDRRMFQFRNDLLWTGLGGNYFPWAKIFQENIIVCAKSALRN